MIRINAGSFIFAAILLLILPLEWILSAVTAALFHEFCHIFVLLLLKEKVHRVQISSCGCMIVAGEMDQWKQVCSLLAGPLGSLTLVLLRKKLPLIAFCGLFHGLYNLLPIIPLDGGRVLRLLLCRLCPTYAESILRIIGLLIRTGLILFVIWLMLYH